MMVVNLVVMGMVQGLVVVVIGATMGVLALVVEFREVMVTSAPHPGGVHGGDS